MLLLRAQRYDAALSGDAFVHYGLVPWNEAVVDDVDSAWSQALASWEVGEPDRPHLVQNILAARALESLCVESGVEAAWAEMEEHLDAAAWRDTLSFALRFLAKSHSDLFEGLMTRLLTAEGGPAWEPVLRRRLLLAASALQGAPDGLAVRQRTVDQLVAWMTDAEAVGREDAVYALLQLNGDSYATERAIEVAQDETRDVWSREAALLVLGRLGGARVSETIDLLTAHMDDAQVEARLQLAAATSMGALGSSGALSETERSVSRRAVARLCP